jgi:hypothetical protein
MRLCSSALTGMALATVFFLGGCSSDEEILRHGMIKIDPRPLEGQTGDVFNGTQEVLLAMRYEQCLADFYQQQPSWARDGIDGSSVFATREEGGEGWFERLCDDPERDQAECEVVSIEQHLEADPQLHVRLRIMDSNLEQAFLPFGPVPLAELAECQPVMRVTSNPAQGFGAGNSRLWATQTWSDSVGAPNQGARIRVRVERVD